METASASRHRSPDLQVVVQDELVRVGPEPDGVHLLRPPVPEPGVEHVLGEVVPPREELVVRVRGALN